MDDENIVEFDVYKIPIYQKTIEAQHALLAEPYDGRICRALKGVDVVHIFMPFFLGTRCAYIANAMPIPVLGCYHLSAQNITYNAHLKFLPGATSLTYDILKRVHYKRSLIRDIYCPSRMIAHILLTHGYKQSLHIISNGYDPVFKKTSDIYENDKIIINSVGRLTKAKRQELIIKAIAKSKYKDRTVLYIAGKGAKDLSRKIGYWIDRKCERNRRSYEYAEHAKKYSLEKHVESLISIYEYMLARNGDNRYLVQDYNDYLKFEFVCNDEKKNLIPDRITVCKLSKLLRRCLKS